MRFWLTTLVFVSILLIQPKAVLAHILLRSSTDKSTAIVHVNPDDDPIAGLETTIFFDIKSDQLNNEDYNYFANITIDGEEMRGSIEIEEVGYTGVRLKYVFPEQGVYLVSLLGRNSSGATEEFLFSQNVSRGGLAQSSVEVNKIAEFIVFLSASMIVVILVMVINRRHALFKYIKDNSSPR